MSLLPKIKSIFFIIVIRDKIKYKFKNRVILKVPAKHIIATTNMLVYYLIVKVSYVRLLLISKLIFIGVEFEVLRKTSWTYNGPTKLERETRSS